MLRDDTIQASSFVSKFKQLKEKFDARDEVHLDSEYHRQLKGYISRLYKDTCKRDGFDDKALSDMREAEMSNLNRLQKLKNGTSYKKEKHKAKHQNEDWG